MKFLISALTAMCLAISAIAQTPTPPASPTYFSTTGVRYSYYDQALTETTNFGVRVTQATTISTQSTPQGLWAVMSIDATPRSATTSTAALRFGARYFLKSAASGNLIFHASAAAGGASVTPPASTTTIPGASLLLNIQGGIGVSWRVCHSFNKNSTVNCVADFDYDINSVSTQAVKPLVGVFVGLAF
jgi:hypothetical protein